MSAAEWGYEQITPADSSSIDVYGIEASKDMSTVLGTTLGVPMAGMPADGRNISYYFGLPRAGDPWSVGPISAVNGPQGARALVTGMSPDGSRILYTQALPSVDGDSKSRVYRVDAQGAAEKMTFGADDPNVIVGSEGLDTVAVRAGGSGPLPVYVGTAGNAAVQVSVDNLGAPMTTTGLGGSGSLSDLVLRDNAVAEDGSSVIFSSVDPIPGDDDGGFQDVYRRVLTPGAQETILISDANGSGDADGAVDAAYRWATADHQRVFFVTSESLEASDTDGEQDVYVRVGKGTPFRVSQGEVVDGSPSGNGSNPDTVADRTEWVMSSQDGTRTFFTTAERLTQDAPADGVKLYERDETEGRTRFVAGPLNSQDLNESVSLDVAHGTLRSNVLPDLSFRGLRPTPDGAVFMSRAPLAGADDGNRPEVFRWTRGGGLVRVSKPDADAPPSAASGATILPRSLESSVESFAIKGGRAVSDDGSRVFFETAQSLTADDTDGGYPDVYAWTAGEGLSLVSPPGREPYGASYLDSSADGTQVYFNTTQTILPGDTDPNANDVYLAILGGGSVPGKPGPDADPLVCAGEACQGPVAGPLAASSIGSVSFAGLGDLPVLPDSVAASVAVSKVKAVTGFAATLKVRVSDAGRISVAGASLRSTSVSASKAGTYSVKITLSSAAKTSLKRRKKLKVSARVSYQASGGRSASKTVSVTFKQPKAKKGGR
ncbi:MAG TPA: hypothetical protein VFY45_08610 [Baekduia sp.]|nr:hypothetical protein [Baekduia sp.]